ncbi:MAG: YraN family protein [Clostridiales bacterium]|jgi:putative endonuclease|nr:YraN family protein [Clostridiales bacterium]
MKQSTREEGVRGETAAERYLKDKGYEILDTNFVCYVGEIDIVARDGKTLVFVEVKSRQSLDYGRPIEAVTPSKVKKIRRTAEFYTLKNRRMDDDLRFDVVEILRGEITHTKNAF